MLFVETSLRDGHQSLISTRMTTEQILSVIPDLDEAGLYALEVWGGATFDASIRFLNEDPWERLHLIRRLTKKTKLQMLLRGQNLVGYRHYADDVVDLFVKKSIDAGIDIIRIFDALNDFRNIKTSVIATIKYGAHCQIALAYTTSPVHTIDYFVNLAIEAQNMGAHSLCIKDMAGLLLPQTAFDLITALKKVITIPINLHSHATTGVISATYLKAVEAGVDIIDTALSPFSGGTSQPATESIVYMLKETLDITLNMDALEKAKDILSGIKDHFVTSGLLSVDVLTPNPYILKYQVPGGMFSNLMSQLKEQQMIHRLDDVLKEIPSVRKDFGYPPLVTPLSQIVGVQATLNIMTGKRYSLIPKEVKDYVSGKYGTPPVEISDDFYKSILGDTLKMTERPADLIPNELDNIRIHYPNVGDDDILTIALFDNLGISHVTSKNQKESLDLHKTKEKQTLKYKVFVEEGNSDKHMIKAPISGRIDEIKVLIGSRVKKEDTLLTMHNSKLHVEILAPIDGVITSIHIVLDQELKAGELMISIV
jgi:oxaloacetate decarboxylase (Na+ extruding) subunit alpha